MIQSSNVSSISTANLDAKAKEVGVKFSSDDWKAAEKTLSSFDQKVKDELCAFANSLSGINDSGKGDDQAFRMVGDDFYKIIRQELLKLELIKDKVTEHAKKTKEKPMKAADKIRQQNTLRIIEGELSRTLKGFDLKSFHLPTALHNKIIELRGIGFFQVGKFLTKNYRLYIDSSSNVKKTKIHFVYNIIIGMQKFYSAIVGITGNSLLNASQTIQISEKFMEDFAEMVSTLKTLFKFDAMLCYENDPQLLFYTDYDMYIPNKGFKPYSHQQEVVTYIKDSIINKKPAVISYKAMTGNGKTVSVVAVAKMIMNLKMMYKQQYENLELLFCCNLRSVKEQASQWLFNAGIPFAIGTIDGDRGLRIINNYNCQTDEKRVAVVCSPEACYEILNADGFKKYVLFLDEPTIGADMKSSAAKMNVRIMTNLPATTVLSSATLPHDIYPWIKESHTIKHGESDFITVYSNKIHIGCEVKTFDGELVVPHLNSKTGEELRTAITRISEIPFLGRAYTTNVAKTIYELMKAENIKDLPDIPVLFKDIENLNTDSIRNLSMTLLSILALQSDEIITKVCSTKIKQKGFSLIDSTQSDEDKGDDDDIEWESEPSMEHSDKVDFDKLGTSDAHKFMRQNLIATLDPVKFAMENFKNLLGDVTEEIGSISKLMHVVEQKRAIWQKAVDRIENQKFDNELERLRETEELVSNKPEFKFPSQFQINCKEHIKHYAKKTQLAIDRNAIRHELTSADIPMNTIVCSTELMILLWAGIGVYVPNPTTAMNQAYLATVLRLAEEGKLAYLISDVSISYGTNYPINRVFISSDFSPKYSINTIFQLMSRAGRVGKSWIAEAYVDNECAMRIINSTRDTEVDIESKNINELYQDIILENIKRDEFLIAELEAKKKAEELRIKRQEEEKARKEAAEKRRIEEEKMRYEAERIRRAQAAQAAQLAQSAQTGQFARRSYATSTAPAAPAKSYAPATPVAPAATTYVPQTQRVTTVSQAMAAPPARVSIQNDFRRENTGQVTRRNNNTPHQSNQPSRKERLERMMKKD
jgi:hypothetical protein